MEEFVEISGQLVELYIAEAITGLTMDELRTHKSYCKINITPKYPNNGYEDFEDEIYNHGQY